jgi:hypothetical protein
VDARRARILSHLRIPVVGKFSCDKRNIQTQPTEPMRFDSIRRDPFLFVYRVTLAAPLPSL